MKNYQERLYAIQDLPLHKSLGVQSVVAEDGKAKLVMKVVEQTINPAGILHGGVIYALSDVASYAALVSLMEENEDAVTHDLHVSVMSSAKIGDIVVIKAKLIRKGRNIAFIETKAKIGDRIIATARVTKSILRAE